MQLTWGCDKCKYYDLISNPISSGRALGSVHVFVLRPYLRLCGTYIQALYEFFQEVLHCLPGIDAVRLITHHHHIYVGSAGCTGKHGRNRVAWVRQNPHRVHRRLSNTEVRAPAAC